MLDHRIGWYALRDTMKNYNMFEVETDKGDLSFVATKGQVIHRDAIVKQSRLVEMCDELDLWTDIGGSLKGD